MYLTSIPNRNSPPAILLRESYREDGKVKTHTLANVTNWNPAVVEAMRSALKGEFASGGDPVSGEIFGVLFALKQLADRLGISGALGKSQEALRVLFLVLARIGHAGSRLSAVRWAKQHATADILGLSAFDENNLYGALDWLAARQAKIEQRLYREHVKRAGRTPLLVLYDVTSSYLEGEQNELAAHGYIRVVLDNHSAHISKETLAYLATRPGRFEYVHTPKHGSWLNLIECAFSKMSRTFLRHIRVNSIDELKARIMKGIDEINASPVVFRWNKFDLGVA